MNNTPESNEIRHLKTALEETAKLAATLKRERDEARNQIENNHKAVKMIERMVCEEREKSADLCAEIASLRSEIKKVLG
jgi:septal ring factor EnvC (AmiA/AmiB activator)